MLKILLPGFNRDRPGRASPRETKQLGDSPARKPGEPSVTGRIEFHVLYPWQGHLKASPLRRRRTLRCVRICGGSEGGSVRAT